MKAVTEWFETLDLEIKRYEMFFSQRGKRYQEYNIIDCEPTDGKYVISNEGVVSRKGFQHLLEPTYVSFWDKYPSAFTQFRTVFNLPKCWKAQFGIVVCKNILAYTNDGVITHFSYHGEAFRYSPKYDKIFFMRNGKYEEKTVKDMDKLLFYMRELYNLKTEELYVL